ncbi:MULTISPECIES: BfmA/BtgA family mobilization protein [unclassified Sphingobacterium]|uniref:BfmA/BtgA family mobilization protein n=1 Tax=unclassified Sphingobacterium TaxID=2609468 RepID=UPI000CE9B812|nr:MULTISPECIES: BfmA/BtgA family mobilization protein [unclassified Sphingobacterium]
MARSDENTRSVRFPMEVDGRLEHLSLKLGRTKRLLVIQMVDYFYRSKKDPADLNDEVLKKELSSGVSRILSFIRKQETDLLVPLYSMLDELTTMHRQQSGAIDIISNEQQQASKFLKANTEYFGSLDKVLKKLLLGIAEKQELKDSFRKILEHYISQRETLGWSVSAARKEELAKQVREALDKL